MTDATPDEAAVPSLGALFAGFFSVAALAFGGVLPWARFVMVDKRRWLTPDEFTDTLALCQLLPGPNIVNMGVAVGARFHGPAGSLVALAGLMGLPVAVVLTLATLYARFATLPQVTGALAGMAAAAAGLVVAMALKLAEPILRRAFLASAPVVALMFAAIAILRLPLWPVILVVAPLSVALAWRFR